MAWQRLRSRLYDYEMRKRQEEQQKLEDTKTDVGWGHQIRSYVLDNSRIRTCAPTWKFRPRKGAGRRPRCVHRGLAQAGRVMRPCRSRWAPPPCPGWVPGMSRIPTQAIIFDMDGTMIDSMPWHAQAWVEFARRRRMDVDVPDLMARTTGRNGTECIRELLGREVPQDEADALTREKEDIYRELFGPVLPKWQGFANLRGRWQTAA